MATRRQTPPPPPPAREFESVAEIDRGIGKIRRRIQEVQQLAADHVPYSDANVDNVEHKIRDTIREVFGEGSQQYRRHGHFSIDDGGVSMMGFNEHPAAHHARQQRQFDQNLPGAITRLQGLIDWLEEKRADFAVENVDVLTGDSQLDDLTGLPLRGDVAPYFAAHMTNPDAPLCVVLIDVDNFKSVNERFEGAWQESRAVLR